MILYKFHDNSDAVLVYQYCGQNKTCFMSCSFTTLYVDCSLLQLHVFQICFIKQCSTGWDKIDSWPFQTTGTLSASGYNYIFVFAKRRAVRGQPLSCLLFWVFQGYLSFQWASVVRVIPNMWFRIHIADRHRYPNRDSLASYAIFFFTKPSENWIKQHFTCMKKRIISELKM